MENLLFGSLLPEKSRFSVNFEWLSLQTDVHLHEWLVRVKSTLNDLPPPQQTGSLKKVHPACTQASRLHGNPPPPKISPSHPSPPHLIPSTSVYKRGCAGGPGNKATTGWIPDTKQPFFFFLLSLHPSFQSFIAFSSSWLSAPLISSSAGACRAASCGWWTSVGGRIYTWKRKHWLSLLSPHDFKWDLLHHPALFWFIFLPFLNLFFRFFKIFFQFWIS